MNPVAANDRVRAMPKLAHHANPDEPFNPQDSQVLGWLTRNLDPMELAGFAFWQLQKQGLIKFDSEARVWMGVTKEDAAAYAAAKAQREERKAAALLERENRVQTGKIWHRPGHPPGREPTVTWDTFIVDKLDAYESEKGEAPTSGQLRDYITGASTCSPATYYRAYARAKTLGQIAIKRIERGGAFVDVLTVKEAKPTVPAIALVAADDDGPL